MNTSLLDEESGGRADIDVVHTDAKPGYGFDRRQRVEHRTGDLGVLHGQTVRSRGIGDYLSWRQALGYHQLHALLRRHLPLDIEGGELTVCYNDFHFAIPPSRPRLIGTSWPVPLCQ